MTWFFLALFGYAALAVVFVLDKRILTREVPQPAVYAFYSTIFMFGALLALPFGVTLLSGADWWWAVVSGLAFGFGLWAMFLALSREEASHVNPFVGAVVTIATFVLAFVFLNESLHTLQVAGTALLLCATLLFALYGERGIIRFSKGFWWAFFAGVCFAVSHVSAKYLYDIYPFLTGFVWTRAATGLVGVLALAAPSVRRLFASRARTQTKAAGRKRIRIAAFVATDKILGIVGVVLIQYAIALGSVTIVNAMVGLQYAVLFLLVYVLSRWSPSFFRERFSKKEIAVESFAIVCILIGSALFVV